MRHRSLGSALLLVGLCSCDSIGADEDRYGRAVQQIGASGRPGMGATVYAGGTTFRTWAPLASQVFVAGDFSGWGWIELGNELNGNFSGDVGGAVKGSTATGTAARRTSATARRSTRSHSPARRTVWGITGRSRSGRTR